MIHQVNNDDADDDGDYNYDGFDNPPGKFLVIIIINTRPMPAYGRQGLAGGIMGPGYSSSEYILEFISYCNLEFSRDQ